MSACIAFFASICTVPALAAHAVPAFSASGLKGWESQGFMSRPATRYDVVAEEGSRVVRAQCDHSASGMVWKGDIDLAKTPVLHWRWKIARIYPGLDERSKAGDDFPARVYVVTGTRWLPWTIKSLSYVWSSAAPNPSWWESPYTDQARMVPVETGAAHVGQWRRESRNVREDFKRVFGVDVTEVGAVAVMTDCDDSGNHGVAWYGDLRFSPR